MKKLILSALLALAGTAAAGESGCVYDLDGTAMVQKAGSQQWRPAVKGLPVAEGDRLKTGAGAWCEVFFKDGSFIKLDADSETGIETLRASAEERVFSFSFLKGKALWLAAKLKGKSVSKFSVRTPSAVCAVRGTDFSIMVSTSGETSVGLFEGNVDISGPGLETKALAAGGEAFAGYGEIAVQRRLSALMKAEKKRYLKVKNRAESLRKRLAKREDFIDDYIASQDKKLREFEQRRKEKLDKL
jgi:hypothetical protein